MPVFAGLDGSSDDEAPAGGGEGVACCCLAPGGWLLGIAAHSAACSVVSHSSVMAEFYTLDLKEAHQHTCCLSFNRLMTFDTSLRRGKVVSWFIGKPLLSVIGFKRGQVDESDVKQ